MPPPAKPATGDAGGAEQPSGLSAVAWASLVEEPPADEGKELKIDSPSDADLLGQGAAAEVVGELATEEPALEAKQSGVEAEVVDLANSPPKPGEPVSDSAVDLGAAPVELIEEPAGILKGKPEDSAVFVAELASDSSIKFPEGEVVELAAEVHDAPVDAESPAAELTKEAALNAMAGDPESSAVDLGGTARGSDAALSAEEAGTIPRLPDGSGIDLQGLPVPGASSSFPPSSESAVDLGSHVELVPESPSGVSVEELAGSGIDVGEMNETMPGSASGIPREELPADSRRGEPSAEEAVAADEATAEQEALAGVEEPPVSEEEVNDLLAGLEETPARSEPGVTAEESAEIAEGEQAIAAAEAEEAAEAAAGEEAAAIEPAAEAEEKPAKQPSRIPALVGGTLLGILIGAGGMFGVQTVTGRGEKEKAPPQMSVAPQPKAAEPTFDAFAAMLRNGDWAEAEKAGIEKFQAARANELVARGEYRLGNYLKNAGSIKNLDDPALQSALQDLQKAADMDEADAKADAIYNLAFVKELAGQLPKAREEYTKGAETFQNDPEKKQRFEAAIERVDWKASLKAGGAAMLPHHAEDRALLLAVLLIGFQESPAQTPQPAQQGQPPQAPSSTPEAGFAFWQAVKLARTGKPSEAVRALDQARKLHDQRRFTRLRKAQNPLSDPAEDIFLRCCDELKVHWSMEKRLQDGGYLTDKNTPPKALDAAIQKAETSAAAVKELTEKLVTAKVIGKDDDLSKGLDRLLAIKKDSDTKIEDLTKKLEKATDDNTKLADDLKTAKKTIEERETDLAAAKEENKKLQTADGKSQGTLKTIAKDLADAKLLDPKGNANVAEAVKRAIDIAKMKDSQGTVRQQRDEIARLSASLAQVRRPEEMLPLWLLLLDEHRDQPELVVQATKDVERVKKNPRATAVQKGEAEVVRGLALRNAAQFREAKPLLEAARNAVDKGEWLARANAALRDVSDPAVYFARQARMLYDHGQLAGALALLDRATKVLTEKEQGKLLAQRSLLELEAAQSKAKGALAPSDPLLIAARKDAEEAAKAGVAEGHYAAGRIAEALGQADAAIKSYRTALAAHGEKLDAEGSRYSMALARVLLLPGEARAAQKIGWRDPAPYPAKHYEDLKNLALMLMLGLQAPLLPGEEAGLEEAQKLADNVLRAESQRPGSVPFDVLAQAMAVKGRWKEAWQAYLGGIRPLLSREHANGLAYLLANDPRLRRPASLGTSNPMDAEKHFAAGLNFYFDRDYANAEKELLHAVENNSQDARYFYFLGLSRLELNRRRDAAADFDQGAKLESLNRPAPAAVSESLERIQGPTRQTLNEVRHRPEPLPVRR
jgi:hypothetical protein